MWGFTALSPYNYISKGGTQKPLRPNVCGAKPQGGVEASGCSITSVPVSLGCRAGLLTPCQARQLIHLIPGKNLSKLTSFATQKATCLIPPMRDPTAVRRSLVYMEVKQKWGEKKKKQK